jgi:HEPN domain-containing protein
VTYELDGTYSNKHSIVTELFVVTADDNYVAARWCYQQGLNVDFFWLAVHCLEKYMKAVLLLNGRPARSYGHDIAALFADVRPLAPELIPVDLTKPPLYQLEHWYAETTEAFIARLYRDGQADNNGAI